MEHTRPIQSRKQGGPHDITDYDRLHIELTPMATAFRHIEPTWRNYIKYVAMRAKAGDEEMKKLVAAWEALTPLERREIMPEALCDLAGVNEKHLIGVVSEEYWAMQRLDSVITAASEHPRMVKATAYWGQSLSECGRDRELFFRITGGLPDKKGSSIVINNVPTANNVTAVHAGAGGFRSMDQKVVEMGRVLDPPEETMGVPLFQETADVFEESSSTED